MPRGRGQLPWRLVGLLLAVLAAQSSQDAPTSLPQFADQLLGHFETNSRIGFLEDEIEELREEVRSKSEDPVAVLRRSTEELEELFSRRVVALRKLAASAEASAKHHVSYDDRMFGVPQDEARCEKYQREMNEKDVHYPSNSVAETSGVHINLVSYQCDPQVMRDFDWTGSDYLEKTMAENKRDSPEMGHQYIGTYSGLTRMYPRRKWEIEPAQITIDLFDPTFRPWFVNAESKPKDVVFLVDYSGSVKGPTMHLIKITMMYMLSTLSPNDYFFGVYFNSDFKPIVSCRNETFMPATTSNKKVFFEKLGEIEEKDQAHFSTPLNFSLSLLHGNLDSNNSLFTGYRSGGHKLLIVFTDGVDEWPHQVLEEEFRTRGNDLVRIFGFSMGFSSGQLPLQQYMACNTNGGHTVIDSIMDVKPQSRFYLDVLSRSEGEALKDTRVEDRDPNWTQLYMEAQGLGPTITLSMPVLASEEANALWGKQRIAGIAAIDVAIKEVTSVLPVGSDQIYAMIVDNNGVLIYHPRLAIPKTEVHSVRRSACYDASQVRSKYASGLRVQYGFSDERVYRLVGLIDSIPTIDLYELEGNSTAWQDLRQRIITKSCHDTPISAGTRELYCTHLKNSPFTLVIVNDLSLETVVYPHEVPQVHVGHNALLGYFYVPRETCEWKLDKLSARDRFAGFASLSEDDCKENIRLARASINAIRGWRESWPSLETFNSTCTLAPVPQGIEPRSFVNSFVHMRGKITAFYPACTDEVMKAVNRKFDREVLTKDDTGSLRITIGDNAIIGYKAVQDKKGNRLMVVGTQWRMNFIDRLLNDWRARHTDWDFCRNKDCLLVTREAFVVGSTPQRKAPGHLSSFDSQLFESLVKADVIRKQEWVDVQAECMARKVAPWTSASPTSSSLLRHVFRSFFKLFKMSFWVNLYEALVGYVAGQPSMNGGICRFQRIKPFERCSLRHFQYQLRLNITKQIKLQVGYDVCSRYANMYPVPMTTLTLIVVGKSCNQYKPHLLYESQPQKLEGCQVMQSRPRRPPLSLNNFSSVFEV
ncbi:unnamed protein product [Caenorhabditis auriculariae]|uniref:VWFA domain-containing protein n=1 Tax=Caenorhabditis auriculariae TaxID=2777116 RepID=A0A8S1HQ91_9PELO|nr:unnamed protein product [Caenorhabditis auriculariae]